MRLKDVVKYVQRANKIEQRLVFDALALCAESGELANHVKKQEFYDANINKREDIQDEMCDVLFHLVSLCILQGITLEELEYQSMIKHAKRWSLM